jgi:hypothetical protein
MIMKTTKKSKASRKLLPAIAMLAMSATMLATSTYAWFSMNKTVTASTMSISATSDLPYLVISEEQNGTFDTAADSMVLSVEAATALKLVTPLNVASNVDYFATATDKTAGTGSETTPTKFTGSASVLWGTTTSSDPTLVQASNTPDLVAGTGFDNGSLDDYVQSSELWFKVLAPDQNGANLKVSGVTFTDGGNNSIADAGRILFVSETGKYMLYDCGTDSFSGDTALLAEVTTTAAKITVYFYFDGTDDASYTTNATNIDDAITATFTFTID